MDIAAKADAALSMVRTAPLVAFDTETDGLVWWKHRPVGYVVTVPGTSVYVPVAHVGGGNLEAGDAFERALADAFASRTVPVVGHNLKFDFHMARNRGIDLGSDMHCTQYAAVLLHEPQISLDALSAGSPHAKKGAALYQMLAARFGGKADRDQMANLHKTAGNEPLVVEYAEADGLATLDVHARLAPRLVADKLSAVYDMERHLIRHVVAMERRGTRVDVSRLAEVQTSFEALLVEALAALPAGFNARSGKDVLSYMTSRGQTDWPTTAKGAPSFPAKWLERSEAGRAIVHVRELRTMLETFLTPLTAIAAERNGRVHPTFHALPIGGYGTDPGRFSASGPNVQQIPKRKARLAKVLRRAFVADEGCLLYEADMSQAEPRLFAVVAKCKRLLDGYNAVPPIDIHSITAEAFGCDRDTVAKPMNMGLLGFMGANSLARHMNWDIARAARMRDQFFRLYPEIKDFQELAPKVFRARGYVRTILGRRAALNDPRFAYHAVSRIIQGNNADILKWKLLQVCRAIEHEPDAQMLMTIHDSFVWQAANTARGRALSLHMVDLMEGGLQGPPFNLTVPWKMDVKCGEDWAEASFGPKLKREQVLCAA